jgi:hypothetical protein
VISESDVRALEELTVKRGFSSCRRGLPSDLPASAPRSAGEYTRATILGDFSKAFSLSGIRVGWILERDSKRREEYWNARAHFSISNNFPGELLAEVAVRNRGKIFDRAREVVAANLTILDRLFFREHRGDAPGWVRPEGGMTALPWPRLPDENARPFCEAAGRCAKGVLPRSRGIASVSHPISARAFGLAPSDVKNRRQFRDPPAPAVRGLRPWPPSDKIRCLLPNRSIRTTEPLTHF